MHLCPKEISPKLFIEYLVSITLLIGQTKAKEKLELTSHSQRVRNFTKLLLPNDYGNISKSMPDF